MAMTILVVDENGVAEAQMTDVSNVFVRLLPDPKDTSYRCLGFIDPYGDTLFNTLQLPVVMAELNQLRPKARSEEEREMIDSVIRLASKAAEEVHVYLKFFGD